MRFGPAFRVAVSVLPAHLVGSNLHRTVAGVLADTGLGPQRLCIEVSEQAVTAEGGPGPGPDAVIVSAIVDPAHALS